MPLKRESSSSEESVNEISLPGTQQQVAYPLDPSLKYQDNDLLEQYDITSSSTEKGSSPPVIETAAPVKAEQESVVIEDD